MLARSDAAKELLKRRRARASLVDFARYTMPGYIPAAHHHKIAKKLEAVESGEIKRLMIFMPPRHGKALAVDTPIPTPNGWTKIKKLQVGDEVFDELGNICRVTAVSEVWKNRPTYKVFSDDGHCVIADANHEWLVRLCRKRPVLKTKSTEWLANRASKRAPMVYSHSSIKTQEKELAIDPYVLGVWLGDGCSYHATITADDKDSAHIRREFDRRGYQTTSRATEKTFGVLGLSEKLRHNNLLKNKHIPSIYLRSSESQRRDLLKGLIDSDGYVAKDGQIEFCGINRDLCCSVRELVHSLGYKASLIEGRAVLNGIDHGAKYRVLFYMPNAASLPRKLIKCREPKRRHRYLTFEVNQREDTICIEVDSPSHLFLCGLGMIPTHNSELASRRFPSWFIGRNPKKSIIAASYNSDLAGDFGREVRNITNSQEFAALFDVRLADDSKSQGRWHTNKGGGYVAAGVGTAVTGRGAHVFIIDDPFKDRQDADSEVVREKVYRWYLSTAYTRLESDVVNVDPDPLWNDLKEAKEKGKAFTGAIVLIQTRWHEDDLAGRLLSDQENGGDEWEVLSLPAINENGEALWPEKYPIERLNDIKAVLSRKSQREWISLYQQTPSDDEGAFFKREWFKRFNLSDAPKTNNYQSTDFATKDDDGDFTELGVWGVCKDGELWALDWWYGQKTTDVWIDAQLDQYKKHQCFAAFGETGQIRRAVEPFQKMRSRARGVYPRYEWIVRSGDKAAMARSFQGMASSAMVNIPNTDWGDRLIDQLCKFPGGKYDDAIDVCALIALAIQSAHPAIVHSQAHTDRPKDSWGRKQESGSWRTM